MRGKTRPDENTAKRITTTRRSDHCDPTVQAVRSVISVQTSEPNPAKETRRSAETTVTETGPEGPDLTARIRRIVRAIAHKFVGAARVFLKRPDAPRLLSILCLLALILLRPGFVLFLFVMTVLGGLVLYFSIGPDQVESWVISRYQRLRERDSDAAPQSLRRI